MADAPKAHLIVPAPQEEPGPSEFIEHPAKLLRIASMVRELLEEVRQSAPDEGGRKRLQEIYHRTLDELKAVLSEDLQRELEALTIAMDSPPTESEIRVAHAQLVGWLEGLFHGIQAALWTQHMAARAQLDEMRRRGLPSGGPDSLGEQDRPTTPGQYL